MVPVFKRILISGLFFLLLTKLHSNYLVFAQETTVDTIKATISSSIDISPTISSIDVSSSLSATSELIPSSISPQTVTITPGPNIGKIISSIGSPLGIIIVLGILLVIDLLMKPKKLF